MGLALNLAIDRGTLDDYQRKAAEKNNQGGGGKVKFIIDAGHGGSDPGAIGPSGLKGKRRYTRHSNPAGLHRHDAGPFSCAHADER